MLKHTVIIVVIMGIIGTIAIVAYGLQKWIERKNEKEGLNYIRNKGLIHNHPEAPHGKWLKNKMANNSNIKTLEELGRSSSRIEREKR